MELVMIKKFKIDLIMEKVKTYLIALRNIIVGINLISFGLLLNPRKLVSTISILLSHYSSVGSEAYLLGIRTYLVCLPNKINESPLLDLYERKPDSLINIIW